MSQHLHSSRSLSSLQSATKRSRLTNWKPLITDRVGTSDYVDARRGYSEATSKNEHELQSSSIKKQITDDSATASNQQRTNEQ